MIHFPTRYSVLLPLIVAISLFGFGCTESKTSQCNKIIEITHKLAEETNLATNNRQTSDPKVYLQVADMMEKASQDMKAINIKDEKLQNYRDGFIKMYRGNSKATREYMAAVEKKDFLAAQAAQTDLLQATTLDRQLVEGINRYCKPPLQENK